MATTSPEEKNAETLRIEPEKLVAGVAAWNKFTRGQEQYSGGLMSGGLKKKGNFAGGYGVYFTSQRIIGVKTSRWFVVILVVAALAGIAGASAVAIIVGTSAVYSYFIAVPIILALIAWGQNRLRFQDPMTLEELDRRKDFEIRRENISGVDLKKPGIVRRGHLIITSKREKDLTQSTTRRLSTHIRGNWTVSRTTLLRFSASLTRNTLSKEILNYAHIVQPWSRAVLASVRVVGKP